MSSGTSSPLGVPHSRGWKAPQRDGHCLGISCTSSPQGVLEPGPGDGEMEMEHMGEPQQPLVPPTMLSPAAWVSLGKLPGGMGLPACTQQSCQQECHPRSLGSLWEPWDTPRISVQSTARSGGWCLCSTAQAETIPPFGGAGGAKLPGKGATGASPGSCLSPAEPKG